MKKLWLALTLFALSPRLATAQEVKNPVVLEKVTYSRAIPKGLRAFVPRGGKSRFWGATKLKYNGQKVWVHVYDVAKLRFEKKKGPDYATQKSGLDLFVFSKSHRLKRIGSSRFGYSRFGDYESGGGHESVGVQTLWLDPQTKKMPVVEVDINQPSNVYGDNGSGVLIIFPKDLQGAVAQIGVGHGASHSGGWFTGYEIDEKGLLSIISGEFEAVGTTYTKYKWDGKQFVQTSSRFEVRE